MTSSFVCSNTRVYYLDTEAIIGLHELLSNNIHLLEEMDPVEPRGIKNFGLLESAVNRQLTGSGDFYKYPDPYLNAATLVYGVIKNHAFHNGNKRAGLLAMIKHLYVNGYVLNPQLNSKELYEILIAIADNKLRNFYMRNHKKYSFIRSKEERRTEVWDYETQVRFIAFWLKKNSKAKENVSKGELKISKLKTLLENKNIKVLQNGSRLEVYVEKENRFLGINLGQKIQNKKEYSLGSSRSTIGRGTLAALRDDFNLTRVHGIDDTFFYDEEAFLDSEIKTYKKIIYQLSKT
ncbi:type II toxin-antitoxin system death-on-curing family toxin [Flavobacterium lipolyticum]|uniref:Type II toxin-antitoxin system death-on-curing family toxin n=1 Tax=Flavobacterium lipolyticum TaxID=2893754 RepID=A0ABS8M2T6_9FLAO|nr:type II toxin-antitoxin system death-on-curing family toxin [Flavobacterium sp. F-126]MCC9019143.1 type II toxin-antitoxin system death-on-curing family toxin [Flavobacterium sp. F-126]